MVRTRFSKFCTKPAIEKTVYIMCFFLYSVYKLLSVDRIGVVFQVTSIRKEFFMTYTLDQHLSWCQTRAEEYLAQGKRKDAVFSFLSDLTKTENLSESDALSAKHLRSTAIVTLRARADAGILFESVESVREWMSCFLF